MELRSGFQSCILDGDLDLRHGENGQENGRVVRCGGIGGRDFLNEIREAAQFLIMLPSLLVRRGPADEIGVFLKAGGQVGEGGELHCDRGQNAGDNFSRLKHLDSEASGEGFDAEAVVAGSVCTPAALQSPLGNGELGRHFGRSLAGDGALGGSS